MERNRKTRSTRTNPAAPASSGDAGDLVPRGLPESLDLTAQKPTTVRSGLRIIERAIRNGWQIPPHVMASLPEMVTQIAETTEHERDRLRAVDVLLAMDRANSDALQAADRVERLDGGGATERVELMPISLRPGGAGNA